LSPWLSFPSRCGFARSQLEGSLREGVAACKVVTVETQRDAYQPPSVTDLGKLEDITRAADGTGPKEKSATKT
jgi:hypothetical protein